MANDTQAVGKVTQVIGAVVDVRFDTALPEILNSLETKIGDTRLDLTAKEFRIIEFLALRKGAVLSEDAFLNHLYGGIDEPEPKIIDVFMCKLRRKIADAGASGVVIDTIWGQGYILREVRDYDTMTISA